MINRIKEQTLMHLDEILNNARRLAQTHDETERNELYQAIEHACFQTRTLVNDLSFVISSDYVKKDTGMSIAQGEPSMLPSGDSRDKKKYVLIAEDVDCNFLLASLVLKKNYRVERAKNGREAVEMVERELPDIVLMDIKMPVMDGYEACAKIKEKHPSLPIIAVTAYTDGGRGENHEAWLRRLPAKTAQSRCLHQARGRETEDLESGSYEVVETTSHKDKVSFCGRSLGFYEVVETTSHKDGVSSCGRSLGFGKS